MRDKLEFYKCKLPYQALYMYLHIEGSSASFIDEIAAWKGGVN